MHTKINIKKIIQFSIFIALATCNLSLQTIPEQKNSPVDQTEKATRTQKPAKFGRTVRSLMIELDKQTIANPVHLTNHQDRPHAENDRYINATAHVTCGPVHATLKTITNKQPLFQKYPLTLHQSATEKANSIACAVKSSIILYPFFENQCDAGKIFTLHHELQHHLYNDCNHLLDMFIDKKNHLINLKENPKIQSILECKSIDQQNETILSILQKNEDSTQKLIRKYQEWRADTQAMKSMQCPYCLQEATGALLRSNEPKRNPLGYLRQWQFQPRIKKLMTKDTICLHHHKNGEQFDTSINDGSTLADRLVTEKKDMFAFQYPKTSATDKNSQT